MLLLRDQVERETGACQPCSHAGRDVRGRERVRDVHWDVDELDEVAEEPHNGEADRYCPTDLQVLC